MTGAQIAEAQRLARLLEKLDRLARDLMIQETIIGDLRKYGFELVSVAEPDLCRDDPTRKLMRQIFGAISEYEKTMIVIKLRGARQRKKARTGRGEGRKPYGHYPGEKRVVERMRALRKEGLGFDRLACTPQRRRVPHTQGDGLAWIRREPDSHPAVVTLGFPRRKKAGGSQSVARPLCQSRARYISCVKIQHNSKNKPALLQLAAPTRCDGCRPDAFRL